MPPVVSLLQGGLGNQMFQYAAGRALAVRLGVDLLLDLSWYHKSTPITPRVYQLGAFPLPVSLAFTGEIMQSQSPRGRRLAQLTPTVPGQPSKSLPILTEPHYEYWPGLQAITVPAYLEGFWQSEMYFKDIAATIRTDISFPPLPGKAALAVKKAIQACPQPVAVHVRRGDYISDAQTKAFHGLCQPEYYTAAIQHIAATWSGAHLFIFSDDPGWARAFFNSQGLPALVVDLGQTNEPWHDMHLMHLCRHHIIANSSFSWWGAWLADSKGLICAPRQWFASPSHKNYNPCPLNWCLL